MHQSQAAKAIELLQSAQEIDPKMGELYHVRAYLTFPYLLFTLDLTLPYLVPPWGSSITCA